MSEERSTAPIVETTRKQYVIACPYCGEKHRHGRVPENLEVGQSTSRVAHCRNDNREYLVTNTGSDSE